MNLMSELSQILRQFKHVKNTLEEELDNSVVANFATTAKDET